jgi:hypothetical protein
MRGVGGWGDDRGSDSDSVGESTAGDAVDVSIWEGKDCDCIEYAD